MGRFPGLLDGPNIIIGVLIRGSSSAREGAGVQQQRREGCVADGGCGPRDPGSLEGKGLLERSLPMPGFEIHSSLLTCRNVI